MDGDARKRGEPADAYKSLQLPSYLDEVIEDKDRTATAHVPEPKAVVSPAFLAHIVLVSTRLPEMKQWYRDVLDAQFMFESEKMVFLTFNEDHHQVAIFHHDKIRADKGVDPEVCGLHHVAFTFANLADLVHTYKRLKGIGITPMRSINHGTTLSNYYLDPDNNRIELQCDTFPSREELNKYLASRAFNRNPIGVLLNFEEVVERFERGDDPWEICSPTGVRHGQEDEQGRPTL
jgi:catechol 2,3-dioxygenase-like lactoylglutathione lyase family enzyme